MLKERIVGGGESIGVGSALAIDESRIRVILFHKHPVSARLLFFKYAHNSICGFIGIPRLAAVIDQDRVMGVRLHPEVVAKWVSDKLGLSRDTIQVAAEYFVQLEVPKGSIDIYLAGLSGYEAGPINRKYCHGEFVSLMDCVGIAPVEMLLAQMAYKVIMGGQ